MSHWLEKAHLFIMIYLVNKDIKTSLLGKSMMKITKNFPRKVVQLDLHLALKEKVNKERGQGRLILK